MNNNNKNNNHNKNNNNNNNNDNNNNTELFLETHIGGNQNDNLQQYKNQKQIIQNNNNEYINYLDDNITEKRIREGNSNGNSNKINNIYGMNLTQREKIERNLRINDVPTVVDRNINISNPIIFPKEYDDYFNYLHNKNLNSINNQVVLDKTIINVNSASRNMITTTTPDKYITLLNNPLLFTNNSFVLTVLVNNVDEQFKQGDKISLTNFNFYNINYKNMKFFFKNGSNEVIINIKPNFDNVIPYYNIMIKIENVKNNGLDYFKNIPLNLINNVVQVTAISSDGDIKFKFNIPMNFYTSNDLDDTLISNCSITFYSIGNYPINLINANYPITEYNLIGTHTISNATKAFIQIKLLNEISITDTIAIQGYWKNDIFFTGGNNMQIAKILHINKGYHSVSAYKFPLEQILNNVVSIRMISSEFPDTQKVFNKFVTQNNITVENNKFYWENALDREGYNITIPVGNYTANELKITMEKIISNVKRIFVNSLNIYPYNEMTIDFDTNTNITSITSFNTYILPDCLISVTDNRIIKINHPQHNLQQGNKIVILKSISFKKISEKYINTEHVITKILDNDNYEITLININLIEDAGDTHGGKEIHIKTKNSFRLFFNKENTCGHQIGFKYVGFNGSITPFSSIANDYTITNLQPYAFDISKILLINNTTSDIQETSNNINLNGQSYFLMLCNNFNFNTNLNSKNYFYKIQTNNRFNGDVFFNTFVDAPIIFNPPIKSIDNLEFTFINQNGNLWNFYNINHSFTLEITSVSNMPENTNLSTFISRI